MKKSRTWSALRRRRRGTSGGRAAAVPARRRVAGPSGPAHRRGAHAHGDEPIVRVGWGYPLRLVPHDACLRTAIHEVGHAAIACALRRGIQEVALFRATGEVLGGTALTDGGKAEALLAVARRRSQGRRVRPKASP